MAVKQPIAYAPAAWELADATAIQACFRGEANPEQQKRAMQWIIENAAGTYDLEYRTDERDHAFVSGRRFVGLQVVKLQAINTGQFRRATET